MDFHMASQGQPQASLPARAAVRNAVPTDSAPPNLVQARSRFPAGEYVGPQRHIHPSTGAGPRKASNSDRGAGADTQKGKGGGGTQRDAAPKRSADELEHRLDVSR